MRPFTRERLEARYRYIESLSDTEIAWEFLRRNPDYAAENAAAPAPSDEGGEEPPDPEPARRWGLRCPGTGVTYCYRKLATVARGYARALRPATPCWFRDEPDPISA
jgi:Family of unknown function (DUF6499)